VLETPETYRSEPVDEAPFSWRALLEIVQALALAVVISVVLNLFVVQVTEVRQRSMESTLLQSDRVLVSKVDYRLGAPQPGDIVVFNPTTDVAIPYVKRVVAVAGETPRLRRRARRDRPAESRDPLPPHDPRRRVLRDGRQPRGIVGLEELRAAARRSHHRQGDRAVLAARPPHLLRVVTAL
jgi:hypothetical protein